MASHPLRIMTATFLLCFAATASAQDPIDFDDDAEPASNWVGYGDLDLRLESTTDIPGRADDLERARSRLRMGLRRDFGSVELGTALEAALGSDRNQDNRGNNDNERSDSINIDELYLRWRANDRTLLTLGKTAFPLATTPLLWDDDLRPIGASISHDIPTGDFSRLRLLAGYFAGDHLYDDESRIAAAQIGWFWREGSPLGVDVQMAWIEFTDLQKLVDRGLGRTNRRFAGRLVSDYELIDVQFGLRAVFAEQLFRARLDIVHNLGADSDADGGRVSLIYGDSAQPQGWELGLAVQRFQRDAVVAAFSSDDWWFHSFARGFMPWVGYGINERWRLQLSAFREKRDGISIPTDRLLLDLRAQW